MKKAVQVLDSITLPKIGVVIYCTCDEIQPLESKSEIKKWFADYKKIVFDTNSNQEYLIGAIDPMISLTDVKFVGIKINADNALNERYPIDAYVA